MNIWQKRAPGVLLCLAVALLAWFLVELAPALEIVGSAVLAILFGAFGVHKFYLGYYLPACLMLGITLLGGFVSLSLVSWAVLIVAIVEGIIYLSKTQAQFDYLYVQHKREWF